MGTDVVESAKIESNMVFPFLHVRYAKATVRDADPN
jgi:hypothetical protein